MMSILAITCCCMQIRFQKMTSFAQKLALNVWIALVFLIHTVAHSSMNAQSMTSFSNGTTSAIVLSFQRIQSKISGPWFPIWCLNVSAYCHGSMMMECMQWCSCFCSKGWLDAASSVPSVTRDIRGDDVSQFSQGKNVLTCLSNSKMKVKMLTTSDPPVSDLISKFQTWVLHH